MDATTKQIKFLTYNVWSREDVVVYKRMKAIGALVEKHDPDVIFFQEITPYIRSIFEDLPWWNKYHCSPSFPEEQAQAEAATQPFSCLLLSKFPLQNFGRWKLVNSPSGRFYMEANIYPDPAAIMTVKPIRVATTQLERPSPPAPMHCMERYAQAAYVVASLSSAENVVFGGDMCWCDDTDWPFPLPTGWVDVQQAARPYYGVFGCWTYDTVWEEEVRVLNGYAPPRESTKKRSDRFVCKLKDYSINAMELIGDTDNVLSYKTLSKYNFMQDNFLGSNSVSLWPSCHRGLILTIVPNKPARPEVPLSPAASPLAQGGGAQAAGVQWMEDWDDSD